jgi:hypothetical protein
VPSQDEIIAGYTVFTAVDRRYLRIFSLWLERFEATGYRPCLRVGTFDPESAAFMRERGIEHVAIDEKIRDPSQLYVARLGEIASLIGAGRNVIHTDADAFWLRPDLPSLIREDFDLQISIGRGMPQNAIDAWGFSLCCGFFILQSNPTVERFLERWTEGSRALNDDQIALNNLMLDQGLAWEGDDDIQRVGSCPPLDLRVGAISDDLISRRGAGPEVRIYHPYLSSSSESNKLLQLKAQVEPTGAGRAWARVRLALNVAAWPRIVEQKGRRVLRRLRTMLPGRS